MKFSSTNKKSRVYKITLVVRDSFDKRDLHRFLDANPSRGESIFSDKINSIKLKAHKYEIPNF